MKTLPDKNGHFDIFGGRYAAETLMPALLELEQPMAKPKKINPLPKSSTGTGVNMPVVPRRFISPRE